MKYKDFQDLVKTVWPSFEKREKESFRLGGHEPFLQRAVLDCIRVPMDTWPRESLSITEKEALAAIGSARGDYLDSEKSSQAPRNLVNERKRLKSIVRDINKRICHISQTSDSVPFFVLHSKSTKKLYGNRVFFIFHRNSIKAALEAQERNKGNSQAPAICRAIAEAIFTDPKASTKDREIASMLQRDSPKRCTSVIPNVHPRYEQSHIYDFERELNDSEVPVGRDLLIQEINRLIDTQGKRSVLTVVGGPGTGKSTLMRFLIKERSKNGKHDIFFLVGAPQLSTDGAHTSSHTFGERTRPKRIWEHLAVSVALLMNQDVEHPIPESDGRAWEMFLDALERFEEHKPGERLCVILDGLDETDDNPYNEMPLARRLRDANIPHSVRFVISSRPTQDLRRLTSQWDMDLNTHRAQPIAIKSFYEAHLAQILKDKDQELDIDQIIRRTERSFLYAQLTIQDLLTAHMAGLSYDVTKAPQGLSERIDVEWERVTRGPLTDGKASRIMSVVAAYHGPLTLDDLHAITGITLEEIARFFSVHEHLFKFEPQDGPAFIPTTRVLGYWHLEIHRHFKENKLGPTAMKQGHKAVAEWLLSGLGNCGIAEAPSTFLLVVQHLGHADECKRVAQLILSPDNLQTLQQSPEGTLVLSLILQHASAAGCMLRDSAIVCKAIALRMRSEALPSLPTCSLWLRRGNSIRASRIFSQMNDGRQKHQDWMRISYLTTVHQWVNSKNFQSPAILPAEGDSRDIASLRAEVLAQGTPATWAHLTNTRMLTHPWMLRGAETVMSQFAEDLASLNTPHFREYLTIYLNLMPEACLTPRLLITLSTTNAPLCADILSTHADRCLDALQETQSEDIGIALGLDTCMMVARSFVKVCIYAEDIRVAVALFRGLEPPRLSKRHTTSAVEQARLAAFVGAKRTQGEADTNTLLRALPDLRFRFYAIEALCLMGFSHDIDWECELQLLFESSHRGGRKTLGNSCNMFLSLLSRYAPLSAEKKKQMCLQLITERIADELEWPGLLEQIASITGEEPLDLALHHPHKDRRWLRGCLTLLEKCAQPEKARPLVDKIRTIVGEDGSCSPQGIFDNTFFTREYFCRIIQHVELATMAASNPKVFFTQLDQLEQGAYLSAITVLMRLPDSERPVSSGALLTHFIRHYSHSLELSVLLGDIVSLFLLCEPVSLGQLLKRPESRRFDPDKVLWPMATVEERQASCEFLTTCNHLLDRDSRSAVKTYVSDMFRHAFEEDADMFFNWCVSLDLSANRFVPDEVATDSYKEAAHECQKWIWNEAYRILAAYNPHRAIKELRSISSTPWPLCLFILQPLSWSRVWRILVKEEFWQAASVWGHLFQHKPVEFSDHLDVLLEMAWDILTDDAICDTSLNGEKKAKTLIAIASRCDNSSKEVLRSLMPLLEGLAVAAAYAAPQALHSILARSPEPFRKETVETILASRILFEGSLGVSLFADFPETLTTSEMSVAARLLISHIRASQQKELGSCITVFFETLNMLDRDAVLLEAINIEAESLEADIMYEMADMIGDNRTKMWALATIAAHCKLISQEERSSLICKALLDLLAGNPETDGFVDPLFTCVHVFQFLSGPTARKLYFTLFESLVNRCTTRHFTLLKTSALCFLAESDLALADRLAEEDVMHRAFPDIIRRISQDDPQRACECAHRHIALLNGKGLRQICIEEDLGDSPEYMAWLLEDVSNSTLNYSSRLVFESIRDIRVAAGHDFKKAFLMASHYSDYEVRFLGIMSKLKWFYLERMTEEDLLWLLDDAPLSIVSALASDVTYKFVEQYPRETLALVKRAADPDLLNVFVELKERWEYAFIEDIRTVACNMLNDYSSGDLTLDHRQIAHALAASLMNVTRPAIFERLLSVVGQETNCISECFPVIAKCLLEHTPLPVDEVHKILAAIG